MYHTKNSQCLREDPSDIEPFEVNKPVRRRYPQWRLGNRLLSCRLLRGMTQAELAARVGVTRKTIVRIENNQHEPVMSLALVIAEVLDEPVDRLFYVRRPQFNAYR